MIRSPRSEAGVTADDIHVFHLRKILDRPPGDEANDLLVNCCSESCALPAASQQNILAFSRLMDECDTVILHKLCRFPLLAELRHQRCALLCFSRPHALRPG